MLPIPKIIHQSWKTAEVPYDVYPKAWVDSWKQHHPDWEYRLWTDADNEALVSDHYPAFYAGYCDLDKPIKKADFCRFLYMHRFGGMYVDLDFVCLRNCEPLFEGHDIVLGRLSEDAHWYTIRNAFMASVPGHEFWLRCAEDSLAAPPHEQGVVEAHAGPFRVEWAFTKYKPANTAIYHSKHIYPIDWHHLRRRKWRQDVVDLARTLRTKSPTEMATALPDAWMVTFWAANW